MNARPQPPENSLAFNPRAPFPLDLETLRSAVEREIAAGKSSAALIILYNEFQNLLGDDALDWRSRRYRNADLS